MKASSVHAPGGQIHDPFQPGPPAPQTGLGASSGSKLHAVHPGWLMLALFASAVPFAGSFSMLMGPLSRFMQADSGWTPALSDEDVWLLDGAMLAPAVIVPTFIGMALDASWSLNMGLVTSLVGLVVGQFLVAMGMAWHSFGLMLVGRLVAGCFAGSLFVVADTIGAQFNKRRRATTFGLIAAVQAIGIGLNMYWLPSFTERSLSSDYEKSNDVMLIASLACLGIGFLWTPLINSCDVTDESKKKYWKWHMHAGVWLLAVVQFVTILHKARDIAGPVTSPTRMWCEYITVILLGPLLGYYMDSTDKSQGGSLAPVTWGVVCMCLVLMGIMWERLSGGSTGWSDFVESLGMGLSPMLIRSMVPQVASRGNVSTSFGIVEGAMFASFIMIGNIQQLSYRKELVMFVANLFLIGYVALNIKHKWQHESEEERRIGELAEPLQGRGG